MESKSRKSVEELEREWWEDWRRADFSWGGLADKLWNGWSVTPSNAIVERANAPSGSRAATLQDYWRDQADHLVEGDGKKWTRIHLPTFWADGSPTGKDTWGRDERAALASVVQEKLAAAGRTEFKGESSIYREIDGIDRRAQLQGAVLVNGSELKRDQGGLHVTLEHAAFIRYLRLQGLHIESHVSLAEVLLARGGFLGELFDGSANLSKLLSLGDFTWGKNTFGPDAAFSNARVTGRLIVFPNAIRGDFNCDHSQFEYCDFSNVTFPKVASFISVQFNGEANFVDAKFEGTANFNRARFEEKARFESAKFSAGCLFNQAECAEDLLFDSALLKEGLHLTRASVTGGVYFRHATILGMLYFNASNAGGKSYFNDATFVSGGLEGGFNFEGACFHKTLDFEKATLPTRPENVSAAFTGCRVKDWIDFRGTGTHWIAALDESILEDKVLLDDPSEAVATRAFREFLKGVGRTADEETARRVEAAKEQRQAVVDQEFRQASELAVQEKRKLPRKAAPKPVTAEERDNWRWEVYEKRLKELEGGCRAIKVAMGRERDEVLEQRYYRFQLMARARQKSVPFWEKFFSALYALFSDYGASMTRPFVAMFFIVLGFAGVFWAWSKAAVGGASPAPLSAWFDGSLRFDPQFFEALRYSASRLLPIGAFGGDTNRWPWLYSLLEEQGAVTSFFVRAVASLESVFALVLVFLFALAVRRRFQIG